MFRIGTGDAFVGKDTGKLPVWIFGNIVGIVFDLRRIAGGLFFAICADAAVGCDTKLWPFFFQNIISHTSLCWNNHDFGLH